MASQFKLLELLKKHYKCDLQRRALNYALRQLEDIGMIRRIRRHKKGPDGKIIFATTINIVQKKGYQVMAKIAFFFRNIKWKVLTSKQATKEERQTNHQAGMLASYQRRIYTAHPPNRR